MEQTDFDLENVKYQGMDGELDELLGQDFQAMLVRVEVADTNVAIPKDEAIDLQMYNFRIAANRNLSQHYPVMNSDIWEATLARWEATIKMALVEQGEFKWWDVKGVVPIAQSYLRAAPSENIGNLFDRLNRGEMQPVSERERSRRFREIMTPFIGPLERRASGVETSDLGISWTIPPREDGGWARQVYHWQPGGESMSVGAAWTPQQYLTNVVEGRWQGHPMAINHINAVSRERWLDGDKVDWVGLVFESPRGGDGEAKVVEATALKNWWLGKKTKHSLVYLFNTIPQSNLAWPKNEWLVDLAKSGSWTEICEVLTKWNRRVDEVEGDVMARIYLALTKASLAKGQGEGEKGEVVTHAPEVLRNFWTDNILVQLANDYRVIPQMLLAMPTDYEVGLWLRTQVDSGIMGMIRVGGRAGGKLPEFNWLASPGGLGVNNGLVWDVESGTFVSIPRYQTLRRWRDTIVSDDAVGSPWSADHQLQRLNNLRGQQPYYPLEYILVNEADFEGGDESLGPEAQLVEFIDSLDLSSISKQIKDEAAAVALQALGDMTLINETTHQHHYIEGGARVCCEHVSVALEHGYDAMVQSLGVSNKSEIVCRYCGVHIDNREEDSFEGYNRETVRTSGDSLQKTLIQMGLAEEASVEGEEEETFKLPTEYDKLGVMASNWPNTSLPIDFTYYVLWIWSRFQQASGGKQKIKESDISECLAQIEQLLRSDRIMSGFTWPLNLSIEESSQQISEAWIGAVPPNLRAIIEALCTKRPEHKEVMTNMFVVVVWVMRYWICRVVVSGKIALMIPNSKLALVWSGMSKIASVSEWLERSAYPDAISISGREHTIALRFGATTKNWNWKLVWTNDDGCNLQFVTSNNPQPIQIKMWSQEGSNGYELVKEMAGSRNVVDSGASRESSQLVAEAQAENDGVYSEWWSNEIGQWNQGVRWLLTPDGMREMMPLANKMGRGKGWLASVAILGDVIPETQVSFDIFGLTHNFTDRTPAETEAQLKIELAEIPQNGEPYRPNITQFINLDPRIPVSNRYSALKLGAARDVKKVVKAAHPSKKTGSPKQQRHHHHATENFRILQDVAYQLGGELTDILSQLREGDDMRERMAHQIYLENNLLHLGHMYMGSNGDEWEGLADESRGRVMKAIRVNESSGELSLETVWEPIRDQASGGLRSDLTDVRPKIEKIKDKELWQNTLLNSIRWKISRMYPSTRLEYLDPRETLTDEQFFNQLAVLAHQGDDIRQLIREELENWNRHIHLEKTLEEVLRDESHVRFNIIRQNKHTKQILNNDYELKNLLRELESNPKKRREVIEKFLGGAPPPLTSDEENIIPDEINKQDEFEDIPIDDDEAEEYGYADEDEIFTEEDDRELE